MVFLPILFAKPGFSFRNADKKTTPKAFLVDVTICSRTQDVLGCFPFIFASVGRKAGKKHSLSYNTGKIARPNDSAFKIRIQKVLNSILQEVDFSDMSGGTFAVVFSTSRQVEDKRFGSSATSAFAEISVKSHPSMMSVGEVGEEKRDSAHLFVGWNMAQASISPLVHKCKSLKIARITTC